tara:strand:+ start:13886 stop:14032 length:147 start_codon:yes stop_codon:yes gene_type:complete
MAIQYHRCIYLSPFFDSFSFQLQPYDLAKLSANRANRNPINVNKTVLG